MPPPRSHVAPGTLMGIVAGSAWLLLASRAAACSGGLLLPPGQTFESAAAAIFDGTAVTVEDPRSLLDPMNSTMDPMAWTFAVDHVEKGNVGKRITITTPRGDASCGFTFWLGARYRVYAYQNGTGPDLQVTIGNGTDLLASLPNPPPVEGSVRATGFQVEWFAMLGALSLVFVAAWVWAARRKQRVEGRLAD